MTKLKISIFLILLNITIGYSQNNVGIGTNIPDSNALLEMRATDKGLLIPRMTSTQRNNMSSSLGITQKGMLVFDNDSTKFFYWNGNSWQTIGSGTMGPTGPAGPPASTIIHYDFIDAASIANTTEQVLKSWTMPANTLLTDGSWIEIDVFGIVSTPNPNNDPHLKVKVGGITIAEIEPFNNMATAGNFVANVKMYRLSNTTQKFSGSGNGRFDFPGPFVNSGTLDLSTNITIEFTAKENIAGGSTTVVKGFIVRKIE